MDIKKNNVIVSSKADMFKIKKENDKKKTDQNLIHLDDMGDVT